MHRQTKGPGSIPFFFRLDTRWVLMTDPTIGSIYPGAPINGTLTRRAVRSDCGDIQNDVRGCDDTAELHSTFPQTKQLPGIFICENIISRIFLTASVVQWSEFLAAERRYIVFLWGTNWIYICYVEESRPPLWSSGQSSWLHNGDVLCFLWGTNW
jgi:predicted AlkP superfamily pyrophosphatase or phosphodiesterase